MSICSKTPSAALNVVRLEVGHLGQQVLLMLATAHRALEEQSVDLFRDVEKADDAADILHKGDSGIPQCDR